MKDIFRNPFVRCVLGVLAILFFVIAIYILGGGNNFSFNSRVHRLALIMVCLFVMFNVYKFCKLYGKLRKNHHDKVSRETGFLFLISSVGIALSMFVM